MFLAIACVTTLNTLMCLLDVHATPADLVVRPASRLPMHKSGIKISGDRIAPSGNDIIPTDKIEDELEGGFQCEHGIDVGRKGCVSGMSEDGGDSRQRRLKSPATQIKILRSKLKGIRPDSHPAASTLDDNVHKRGGMNANAIKETDK